MARHARGRAIRSRADSESINSARCALFTHDAFGSALVDVAEGLDHDSRLRDSAQRVASLMHELRRGARQRKNWRFSRQKYTSIELAFFAGSTAGERLALTDEIGDKARRAENRPYFTSCFRSRSRR
jgi:hypothetical protein